MIDWKLAVDLWRMGYSTFAIARYIGNDIDDIIHESRIYNHLPYYRTIYK
jgi:hypothetical protein